MLWGRSRAALARSCGKKVRARSGPIGEGERAEYSGVGAQFCGDDDLFQIRQGLAGKIVLEPIGGRTSHSGKQVRLAVGVVELAIHAADSPPPVTSISAPVSIRSGLRPTVPGYSAPSHRLLQRVRISFARIRRDGSCGRDDRRGEIQLKSVARHANSASPPARPWSSHRRFHG